MGTPRVSVLLPVRNGLPYLPQAVASLGRQTLADYEVVAVDDGSTDGSAEMLDTFAARDARIRVLHRSPAGLVPALNAGLGACRAELVARMDADDVAGPRRLELQVELLGSRPDVGVVSCMVRHFPRSRVAGGLRRYEAWLNSLVEPPAIARERFVESPVAHPSVMVRRELLDGVGGWRDVGWPEDYDLWLRLLERGVDFAKVTRLLHFWRDHGDRLTRRDDRYAPEPFADCRAHFLLRGPLAGTRGAVVWGAGPIGRRLARRILDGGAEVSAFVDIDPAKIGRVRHGRPVVAPEELPALLGGGVVVLAAVGARGAREVIRARLVSMGLEEGVGFWCVA